VHLQIADDLRAQMASGHLAPGDPIPTAAELSERWHCSVGSARSAIGVLKAEGRVTAGRGKPATVRTPPVRTPLTLSPEFSQRQKELALCPETDRRSQGTVELTAGIPIDGTGFTASYSLVGADAELAREFDVPVGESISRRIFKTVDRASGTLLAWSVSYIPVRLIESNPDLLDETKEPWPGGHHHQLFTVGIEIDQFRRTVTAAQPTPADRQHWDMDDGVPLLCVRSKSVDPSGRVVEVSDATYPADRTELTFVEQLQPWSPEQRALATGSQ
jgi:GntR family transcriptional regulator